LNLDEIFIKMIDANLGEAMLNLIRRQIIEPNEESELGAIIKTIGTIEDEISQVVRMQYEDNPYPRWLSMNRLGAESLRPLLKRLFPHIPLEQLPDNQVPDILIAGCGTGQRVIDRALRFRSSRVLGLDISLSSLSYAKRKAREFSIPNVEFIHADLLNIGLLNERFDMIECIGVLHHMADPIEGWRVLAACLKPGAVMRI